MKAPISIVQNSDCLEGMKKFPDNFFDWAVVDLEYGIGASKPKRKPKTVLQKNGGRLHIKNPDYEHSDWDFQKSPPEYFKELFRVSRNQVIFGGNYYGLEGGYLVWDKLNGTNDQFGCELAWLSFTKRMDIVYYMWSGMMQGEYCGKDVRKALRQKGDKTLNEKRIHETQKPIMLYDWLINEYEIRGRVLDTHLGSGSNRIANYRNGNDFWSFEICPEKFENQQRRFELETLFPRFDFNSENFNIEGQRLPDLIKEFENKKNGRKQ